MAGRVSRLRLAVLLAAAQAAVKRAAELERGGTGDERAKRAAWERLDERIDLVFIQDRPLARAVTKLALRPRWNGSMDGLR